MKPTVISAEAVFEEFRARLKWEWVAGLGASDRRFDEVAVRAAQSGADLVGHLNSIHPYRIQILGEREFAYITHVSVDKYPCFLFESIVYLHNPVLTSTCQCVMSIMYRYGTIIFT